MAIPRPTFGDRVRRARKAKGLSLRSLSALTNIPQYDLLFLEARDSKPYPRLFNTLNKVLELGYLNYSSYRYGLELTRRIDASGLRRVVVQKAVGISKTARVHYERGDRLPPEAAREALENFFASPMPQASPPEMNSRQRRLDDASIAAAREHPGEAWAMLEIWRIEHGLSKAKMADKLEVGYTWYRKVAQERRTTVRSVHRRKRIKEITGLDLPSAEAARRARETVSRMQPWPRANTGERIAYLRTALEVSQGELARQIGVRQSVLSGLENHNQRLSKVPAILKALGLGIDAILAPSLDAAIEDARLLSPRGGRALSHDSKRGPRDA